MDFLDDEVDHAVAYLQAAGIRDYDWKPVIADMKNADWDYFGFDLADSPYKRKSAEGVKGAEKVADFKVAYPAGLEQWFAPSFDAEKAGWKDGKAPFGMKMDEMVPENYTWIAKYPPYPMKAVGFTSPQAAKKPR